MSEFYEKEILKDKAYYDSLFQVKIANSPKRKNYIGHPKLKGAGVEIEYTPEQLEEYIKCSNDCEYFIKNYVKIVHVDKGLVNFEPYPYQHRIIESAIDHRYTICKLPRQCGKQLSNDTDILTSTGFRKLGNLNVGDILYGPDGKETKITFITDTMYDNNCYEMVFDNGDKLITGTDHLWVVKSDKWKKEKQLTTEELHLFLDSHSPYIKFTKPLIFSSDETFKLFGDKKTRENLINSLSKDNNIIVDDKHYLNYLRTILSSLGIKSTKLSDNQLFYNKEDKRLYIKSIRKIETVPVKCLKVDNQSELFLAGNTLIPTHNTTAVAGILLWHVLFNEHYNIAILANKESKAKEILHRIKLSYELLPWWCQQGVSEWNKNSISLSNGSKIFASSTSSDAVRGESLNFCISTKSSTITVKNKIDGIIKNIKISDLILEEQDKEKNTNYEVLTPDGFKNYSGYYISTKNTLKLNLENTFIECTWNHKLFSEDRKKWISASKLNLNEYIRTKNGKEKVLNKTKSNIKQEVVDLINVQDTRCFYVNDIVTHNCYLDEFAFVEPNIQENFWMSVLPTISSGKTTKILITSTSHGMELFYKIWEDAVSGKNGFNHISAHWSEMPGRDDKWKEEQLKIMSKRAFSQEYECVSGYTIITVKEKETKKIMKMTIEDLYEESSND